MGREFSSLGFWSSTDIKSGCALSHFSSSLIAEGCSCVSPQYPHPLQNQLYFFLLAEIWGCAHQNSSQRQGFNLLGSHICQPNPKLEFDSDVQGMCESSASQRRSVLGTYRDQHRPWTRNYGETPNLSAISTEVMFHVPWKEVWDVVSFHCIFFQHLYRFSGNAASSTLTMAFIKMLLLLY